MYDIPTEPLLPWGQLGVSELSVAYDPDLSKYLMVTLPAFSNKVRCIRRGVGP